MNNLIIGIDIGGTKTRCGIVNLKNGKVLEKKTIQSKKFRNDKKNLANIRDLCFDLINLAENKYKTKISKIGIGIPELINKNGVIRDEYNFKWHNFKFQKYFNKYKLNAIADSDVRNALRAEKFYGLGKKYKNLIYVNIGTGLSYSQYRDNEIYLGNKGYAIHFASSKLIMFDPTSNKKISLIPEKFYSGKSITKYLTKLDNNINYNYTYNNKQIKYLNNISESLGSLIANLINSIDPQAVILGGGVVIKNIIFQKTILINIRKYILAKDCKKIPIKFSKLNDDAGLIGATALFKS